MKLLIRSKFKFLKIKDKINLELPLKYGTKFLDIYVKVMLIVGKVFVIKKLINHIFLILKYPKKRKNI
jgi:riboflavin synthase